MSRLKATRTPTILPMKPTSRNAMRITCGTRSEAPVFFAISGMNNVVSVRHARPKSPADFGILTWSTSAVCFGPPWAQQTSTLDLSVSLDSEAGVGLESQGGTIRADSVGV